MATTTKISEKDAQRFADDVRAAGLDAPWFHPGASDSAQEISGSIGFWKWDKIEPLVRSTPDFVAPERARNAGFCVSPIPEWPNLPPRTRFQSHFSICFPAKSLQPTVTALMPCGS